MAKLLKVYGKKFTSKSGNTFVSYSLHSEKNDEWFKVKFTKECENRPSNTGFYLLNVEADNISIEKGKKTETGTTNRTIWVHAITSCTKDTASDEELARKKAEMIEDL